MILLIFHSTKQIHWKSSGLFDKSNLAILHPGQPGSISVTTKQIKNKTCKNWSSKTIENFHVCYTYSILYNSHN